MGQEALDAKTIDMLRKKCKESMFFLARFVLEFNDLDINIHKPICDALQGDDTRFLIVLPRDWFKSTLSYFCRFLKIAREINDRA